MWDVDYEKLEKVFLKDQIGKVLMMLPDKERTVLVLRFFYKMTLKECGNKLGVTQERIRQKEARALRHLRHPTKFIPLLKDFVPDFSPPTSSTKEHIPLPSIFSMHPAFREVNLYAKKLPLLKKEEKARKRKEAEAETVVRGRAKEDELRAKANAKYAELMQQQAERSEKELWWISECETEFDHWYREKMGRPLKENKIKKEDLPEGNNPRSSVGYL